MVSEEDKHTETKPSILFRFIVWNLAAFCVLASIALFVVTWISFDLPLDDYPNEETFKKLALLNDIRWFCMFGMPAGLIACGVADQLIRKRVFVVCLIGVFAYVGSYVYSWYKYESYFVEEHEEWRDWKTGPAPEED